MKILTKNTVVVVVVVAAVLITMLLAKQWLNSDLGYIVWWNKMGSGGSDVRSSGTCFESAQPTNIK